MSKITVNGKEQDIELPVSVYDLILRNRIDNPGTVSVQVNSEFVPRENFQHPVVTPGDEVEFMYFMGGGSGC
jgi:sulfur carrier protein